MHGANIETSVFWLQMVPNRQGASSTRQNGVKQMPPLHNLEHKN
jgi:hypothetical protein